MCWPTFNIPSSTYVYYNENIQKLLLLLNANRQIVTLEVATPKNLSKNFYKVSLHFLFGRK